MFFSDFSSCLFLIPSMMIIQETQMTPSILTMKNLVTTRMLPWVTWWRMAAHRSSWEYQWIMMKIEMLSSMSSWNRPSSLIQEPIRNVSSFSKFPDSSLFLCSSAMPLVMKSTRRKTDVEAGLTDTIITDHQGSGIILFRDPAGHLYQDLHLKIWFLVLDLWLQ